MGMGVLGPRTARARGVLATLFLITAACGAPSAAPSVAPAATIAPTERATAPAPTATAAPATPTPKPLADRAAFQRGVTFADWKAFEAQRAGLYEPTRTATSLQNLAKTGANWISLVVACGQENEAATVVTCRQPHTATDAELRPVVDLAHRMGLRVMLKPQLDFSKEPDTRRFRGHIGAKFATEAQWRAWFASYREMIVRYAAFSQAAGVDLLVVGVELGGTSHRADDWRAVVRDVRQVYSGPLTYGSLSSTGSPFPHGEEVRITWWDALDYVGIDAYYPLASKNDPTSAELRDAWTARGHVALLESLSRRTGKQIIFTEVGFRSGDGAARSPGSHLNEARVDVREQADLYQGTLDALWGRPWLAGLFWWQWFVDPNIGGPQDDGFSPFGKPAEQVLRSFYADKP